MKYWVTPTDLLSLEAGLRGLHIRQHIYSEFPWLGVAWINWYCSLEGQGATDMAEGKTPFGKNILEDSLSLTFILLINKIISLTTFARNKIILFHFFKSSSCENVSIYYLLHFFCLYLHPFFWNYFCFFFFSPGELCC